MSEAGAHRRQKVMGAIKSRLGAGGSGNEGRRETVQARLGRHARHLEPQRVKTDTAGLKELFAAQLRSANATVLEAASDAELPSVIAAYLRSQNLPLALRAGEDAWLRSIGWSNEPALSIATGRAEPADEVGLTHAVAGVAETGTLVLASGAENPVTVTFLPETSIVVMRAADLVGPYESALDEIRKRYGDGEMPRTVNLVSGPSRTADVGGRLVTGAHGPRRLCVVIVAT